jgi:hypothetical protein
VPFLKTETAGKSFITIVLKPNTTTQLMKSVIQLTNIQNFVPLQQLLPVSLPPPVAASSVQLMASSALAIVIAFTTDVFQVRHNIIVLVFLIIAFVARIWHRLFFLCIMSSK